MLKIDEYRLSIKPQGWLLQQQVSQLPANIGLAQVWLADASFYRYLRYHSAQRTA